ncbi:flagellar biosynthesis protein FlhG [Luteibacter rhizovicinus]|uniref:Flagellar biosynthesis protein FlhG n=1 Tax=Luteibacter rhizovicinus TaxID=242606 RepID=A0A4R3YRA7_9GAMM|nr:MinD/ParA family protein [Luteibacter rhizovicinus]TCV94168.1 flagellar biosynthesis protein FlhG [Luteibacter rhizovicinus]
MTTPVNTSQAAGINWLAERKPCRSIAVAGGKGGVGKTTVAVNLAMALSMGGRDVVLLDADLGMANIDVLLGLQPTRHLGHMLDGACTIEELVLQAPHGLKVIPATSGARRMAQLPNIEHAAVIRAFDEYAVPPEFLIVDTAAGISDSVSMFAAASDEVVVVVCDEPASLTDAYALIKVLSREFGVGRFRVVANMVRHAQEGRQLFEKLSRVTGRFLDVSLDFMGMVPHDEYLRQAIRRQAAVVEAWPSSRSAVGFKNLARAVDTWGEPEPRAQGRIGFFADRASMGGGLPL